MRISIIAVAVIAASCTVRHETDAAPPESSGSKVPTPAPKVPTPDAGTPPPVDAGTPPPPPPESNAGPWPKEAVADYSQRFGVGTPQSVGIDEGLNLWFLDGDRIGVLRPGDAAARWTQGIGQARQPFGTDSLATGSTVICGGAAGRAYVGYSAREMERADGISQRTYIPGPGEAGFTPERYAEYQKGDLDVVRLAPDGSVALEEHLWRTVGLSNADKQIGIHNTNDFHYEEDRSIFSCARVARGPDRGDLYVTTNHGVTRIQGLTYNSHRHPGWYLWITNPDGTQGPALQCPPMHGLGIAPNGDVLVANEQMVGVLVPSRRLEEWDRENTWDGPTPWRFKGFNESLNDLASDDRWRAFQQTTGGRYYLGSDGFGLWSMAPASRSTATWTRVAALPSGQVPALAATDDGALYVGTDGAGLWRLEADGATLARVAQVPGQRVLQLVYEPSVSPSMLLVLTDRGLTVLRGP